MESQLPPWTLMDESEMGCGVFSDATGTGQEGSGRSRVNT